MRPTRSRRRQVFAISGVGATGRGGNGVAISLCATPSRSSRARPGTIEYVSLLIFGRGRHVDGGGVSRSRGDGAADSGRRERSRRVAGSYSGNGSRLGTIATVEGARSKLAAAPSEPRDLAARLHTAWH